MKVAADRLRKVPAFRARPSDVNHPIAIQMPLEESMRLSRAITRSSSTAGVPPGSPSSRRGTL